MKNLFGGLGFDLFAERNKKNDHKLIVGKDFTETVSDLSFDMVYVKGGTFRMGATEEQDSEASSYEKPVHLVTLSDYYIGRYEVTQGLWETIMGSKPSYFRKGDDYPVERMSWDDMQFFLKKLSDLTGRNYVLPTEAQWEYAARGGVKSKGYKYSGSNEIDDVAWYLENSGEATHPVGKKAANELGIYDMSGNVWEWCRDWYDSYSEASQRNPIGPESGSSRVIRGGSWGSDARYCRVSNRLDDYPSNRNDLLGFRVALLP